MILQPEQPEGNIEYKWKLVGLDEKSLENKMTQLCYRLDEGFGEAIYFLGVRDNGTCEGLLEKEFQQTLETLGIMCERLNLCIQEVQVVEVDDGKKCGEYIIRNRTKGCAIDLKIGVIGNVDSGKSTLVGVLSKGCIDNGKGLARSNVFNFKHELDSGRTSSIGHQILGFDERGNSLYSKKSWTSVTDQAIKIVTFYDLAGHEKYLRTTIYGLSSCIPDYCFLLVAGNQGVSLMTREHISLCLALKIPFVIMVTKIDIAPDEVLRENMRKMNQWIKQRIRKIPYRIRNESDVLTAIRNMGSESVVPIFHVSNVTHHHMDLVRMFLNLVPVRNNYSAWVHCPVELWIDSHYNITGHGTVVCGLLRHGTLRLHDAVVLGPLSNGDYIATKAKCIHVKHREVREARAGLYVCVALKGVSRKNIKKGMILLGEGAPKLSVWEFWAKIEVIQCQSTTIRPGYQPYLHIGNVRQCATIMEILKIGSVEEDKVIRTGDRALVRMKFMHKPEFIKKDMKVVFRDGMMKAMGVVCDSP